MKTIITLGKWSYRIEQDQTSGELKVLEYDKVGVLQKAMAYARAEASKLAGPVALPILEQRKAACDGCESAKKVEEGTWYCKSCGCPEWERSRLQVKWEMPAATCPLGKWPE